MEYKDYEEKLKEIQKKNKKYLDAFLKWLKEKGLVEKTIKQHLSNADFYINDYLNYYEITEMKEGCYGLDSFFGDWFIRKCMWSTAYSIKTTVASLKKFYLCMKELNYIDKADYDNLCDEIKEGMDDWCYKVEKYNDLEVDFDYDDFFFGEI